MIWHIKILRHGSEPGLNAGFERMTNWGVYPFSYFPLSLFDISVPNFNLQSDFDSMRFENLHKMIFQPHEQNPRTWKTIWMNFQRNSISRTVQAIHVLVICFANQAAIQLELQGKEVGGRNTGYDPSINSWILSPQHNHFGTQLFIKNSKMGGSSVNL